MEGLTIEQRSEIDSLANKIATLLDINPYQVGLSYTNSGWFADIFTSEITVIGPYNDNPVTAMDKLLKRVLEMCHGSKSAPLCG
jgi:hypothetical protein